MKPANLVPAGRWRSESTVARLGVVVGNVIRAPEGGYAPGVGVLTLRVSEIVGRFERDGHTWVEVYGHEVKGDGTLKVRRRYTRLRVDVTEVLPRRGR